MRICYLTPSLNVHGGIRVIIEHCNYLARKGHDVTLQSFGVIGQRYDWVKVDRRVNIIYRQNIRDVFDVVVAGSPPLCIILQLAQIRAKKFFFLQMAEHLFNPNDLAWQNACRRAYSVDFPIIGISKFTEYIVRNEFQRGIKPMYYIGNGVSGDFEPCIKEESGIVLVEGWEAYNAAKDIQYQAPEVAGMLKMQGYKIIAYSQFPLKTMKEIPDEYYCKPSQESLIGLYQRATILIKSSVYDARSCAPVEAMACNCVPVRAIYQGDDDLIHGYNSLISEYGKPKDQYENALKVLQDENLRHRLIQGCKEYRKQFLNWDTWGEILEDIFTK